MEVSEEELAMAKNPDLEIADAKFLLSVPNLSQEERETVRQQLLHHIKEKAMAPFYKELCQQYPDFLLDAKLLSELEGKNEKDIKELEAKLDDATANLGSTEVREAHFAIAEYFTKIGDKKRAEIAWRLTSEKTVGLGGRLDVTFYLIRIGFFFGDMDMVTRNIEKARAQLEEGADWDRKNRLKVYEASYFMGVRQFQKAAELFLDALATFTSYELFSYKKFIFYTIVTAITTLERPLLKTKIIDSPEIISIIDSLPSLGPLLNSLYNCEYSTFLLSLADACDQFKRDRILAPHHRYFSRELRIRGYSQMLESYRSVQLNSMAKAFGVSSGFLDSELAKFIAAGRLHCKIDKVGGVVETNRPDSKNAQYQQSIKQGDILLNRLQKLSQVINL